VRAIKGNQENSEQTQYECRCPIPVKRLRMVLYERFANIYQPMNLSEWGLLDVVWELHKSALRPVQG
jgi:hypothetical protein